MNWHKFSFPSQKGKKTPFILLHGAWYTSKCWRYVAEQLEKEGHKVECPDFPYYTENSSKESTRKDFIHTTIAPLLDQIIGETGQKPILVGHSLAGTIISETAGEYPDKVDSLVFLAGFMLPKGVSVLDLRKYRNQQDVFRKGVGAIIHANKVNGRLNVATLDKATAIERFCQDCSPAEQEKFMEMIVWDMPEEPIRSKVAWQSDNIKVPKIYIKTLYDKALSIEEQEFMIQKTPCQAVYEIESGHSPFINKSPKVVEFLVKATKIKKSEAPVASSGTDTIVKPQNLFKSIHYAHFRSH